MDSFWRWFRGCMGFGLKPSDLPLQRDFLLWTLAWAVTYVAATQAIVAGWVVSGPMLWLAVALPLGVALMALRAYWMLLRHMDELMRRVQYEGTALGFAITLVVVVGYVLFERVGAPGLSANTIILTMMISWAVGQLIAVRRLR